MFGSFRLAMTWVHTWFGLLLGYVLLVAFFFGSLSVFAEEIDRWSSPVLRQPAAEHPSFGRQVHPAVQLLQSDPALPAGARMTYFGAFGSGRDALLHLGAAFAVPHVGGERDEIWRDMVLDGRTGQRLEEDGSHLGSEVFFPIHFNLTAYWGSDIGRWLIAASAFVMMIAAVSGVVIHRKLLREFFTFRPGKLGQRRVLDLHNLTGIAALPFHFFFAFTGILIFSAEYFPGQSLVLGEQKNPEHQERAASPPAQASEVSVQPLAMDDILRDAQRRWSALGWPTLVGGVELHDPGTAEAEVVVVPAQHVGLGGTKPYLTYSAASGRFLHGAESMGAIAATKDYLESAHMVQFEHDGLRWLFFLGGLIGCVCIATGFVFFVGKRRQRHAAQGRWGAQLADACGVASLTGMLIATAALMLANRVLSTGLREWEMKIFWYVWLLSLAHAVLRTGAVREGKLAPAWREQCWALAVLCIAAALANWITTGDHLVAMLIDRYWPVAGVDLTLLTSAAFAVIAARRLGRREGPVAGSGKGSLEEVEVG